MSTILDLQNITTTVNAGTNEEKQILKNINLKLEDGDSVTLLGTNGAGKSTLLNIINGSIFPTSGKILLKDQDLTNLSEVKRAKYIAQVFQDLFLDFGSDLAAVFIVTGAGLGSNGEALRHRHAQVGHLRQVGAFAAQQFAHGTVAFGEQVHVLVTH